MFDELLLPLQGKRNLTELLIAHDDGIPVLPCDFRTELCPLSLLKVLRRCNEDLCIRIQAQELCAELFRQMSRHNHERFLAQPNALGFHRRRLHLEGLSCTNDMSEKSVPAEHGTSNRIFLMRFQLDRRIHPGEGQTCPIKRTRYDIVEVPIVVADKAMLPILILIHPFDEGIAQIVHLLCNQQRRFLIDASFLIANAYLTMVQCCLKNVKCTRVLRSVGGVHFYLVGGDMILLLDPPLSCCRRILNDSL